MFDPDAPIEQNILTADDNELVKAMENIERDWDKLLGDEQKKFGRIYSLIETELAMRDEVDNKLIDSIMEIANNEKVDPEDIPQLIVDDIRNAINDSLRELEF